MDLLLAWRFNPKIPGHTAGEFGHNDFYPVILAAAQALCYRPLLQLSLLADRDRDHREFAPPFCMREVPPLQVTGKVDGKKALLVLTPVLP